MKMLTVYLFNKKGHPVRGKLVYGTFPSFIMNGSIKPVSSDIDGKVMLTWSSSANYLNSISFAGVKEKGKFLAGSLHSFTV